MKNSKTLLHAAIWFSTSIAVIAGLIITKIPYCLAAFGISTFASIMLDF